MMFSAMRKNKGLFLYFTYFLSFLFFLFSHLVNSIRYSILALLILTMGVILYCLCDAYKHMIMLLFQVSFVMFLSGSLFVALFNGLETQLLSEFTQEINIYIIDLVFISQFCLPIGYLFAYRKIAKKQYIHTRIDEIVYPNIKQITSIGLIITVVPRLIDVYYNSVTQISVGYVASYLGYEVNIPSIIVYLSKGYIIFFWMFLLTKPEKKTVWIVLIINLLISIIRSSGGHRSYIVLSIISTILYLSYRQIEKPEEKWMRRKWLFGLALFAPIVIVLLVKFSYSRLNLSVNYSFLEFLNVFFESSSADIIGYSKLMEDSIPKGNYTFGCAFTVMIRNQSLIGKLFGFEPLRNNTVEMARKGHAFGQTITYLMNPNVYFRGGGYGSTYVAEVSYDFGFIGLIIANLLLGAIMSYIYSKKNNNIIFNTLKFMMIESIMMIPRESFFSFVYYNITFTNIIYFIFIYFIFKLMSNKKIRMT